MELDWSFKNHHIQNNMDHSHLQASTPYWVLLSFQFWIATPKGKFYMVKNFWLNIWMISSKCSINQFFNLIFIKVSAEKHCSSSIEPLTCTITSSGDLMYSWIFCSRIQDEKQVLHSLVSGFISNGFCIANLTLFFMVRTNKDLCKSKVVAKNNLGTHTLLGLTFLSWQSIALKIVNWATNLSLSFSCNQYWAHTQP